MKLKKYQQQTIDTLATYFKEARVRGPKVAFEAITTEEEQAKRLRGRGGVYRPIKGLEAVPYVCLRLPTGGGKTLLAAHSIGLARDYWLEREYPVAVWLVPSDTIRRQTVEALKDTRHAYRRALDDTFEGRVRVFDIADFTQVTPQDLRAQLCVFVGTIQTLKVSNTNGRKVYQDNEFLEPHFSTVSPNTPGLERNEEGPRKGEIRYSFANLLHLHRPLVIVDEAHSAVTSLSFEMQQRINPSAIVEFTATPKDRSNILHSVTAQELKDEQMIKMPVVLEEHTSWQSAVNGAILKRAELAEIAATDTENYIRPIVLFQAQNKDQEVTVDVLRDHLVEVKGIPPEQIAVVTGNQRELDGIDLKDPACPIEYVVTVQALKEGWDCSFAYVFCSVANISSAGAAEQLLGRVLRMPYAKKRTAAALNKSYACLNSPAFQDAVRGLVDRLVDMGFEESEVQDNIEHAQPELLDGMFGRQTKPRPSFSVSLPAPVEELKGIELAAPNKVKVAPDDEGMARVSVTDFPTPVEEEAIFAQMPEKHHGAFKEQLERFKEENKLLASPAQRGEVFIAPRLMAHVQGDLLFADNERFFEYHEWALKDHSHQLSEREFSVRQVADTFEIDLDGDKLKVEYSDQSEQLMLDIGVDGWTERGLVLWLDRKVRDRFVGQGELVSWLTAVVSHLINTRKIPLAALMRCQFVLARCLQKKLETIYDQERSKSFQMNLFAPEAQPELSFENGFRFFDGMFAGVRMYRGRQSFPKHFTGPNQIPAFDGKGDDGGDGEEFRCAVALDSLPQVKHWIRNVPKHPNAFWLPLSGGKFYPDFVAELVDGRTFVVEYKGDHLKNDPEQIAKVTIGELWQRQSGGKAVFRQVVKEDDNMDMRAQMIEAIGG
ncbi:DEAD/DEAH box helicase [Celeribacter baekdonensis]|uniref:Restriction endonuclease subunit R n=1 Tax=Celeribacter baekdonensis TaxID=875171 RepID=A0A2R4M0H2_9RHOB|nr:DEAD/DEAH box helicase family protein [Celeribacter baekdonensis]AVW90651.1 restriction endonuclease subunit R [Celeribacter baekdonensis]